VTPASFSPALRRLGLAVPPPFVGRHREVPRLAAAIDDTPLTVVSGAVGAGKTRLCRAVTTRPELARFAIVHVTCAPAERAAGVLGRVERLAGVLPGGLEEALAERPLLAVIDDVHRLAAEDAAAVAAAGARAASGRLVLSARDVLPLARDARAAALEVDGLDEAAARELWAHLEGTYGPTPATAVDSAIVRTRGMPLAMRREYAIAAFGADAWSTAALAGPARAALDALAVLGLAAGPDAVASLCPDVEIEPALIELVSRQLIDPLLDGRFALHDAVRERVLAALPPAERAALAAAAADLVAASDAGLDAGALPLRDGIDRLAAEVGLRCDAGQVERAAAALRAGADVAVQRGAARELGELAARVEAAAGRPLCADLAAELAVRRGAVAEALALGGTACRATRAALELRAGDVAAAARDLDAAERDGDPDLRCRAAAVRAEWMLDRGEGAAARAPIAAAFDAVGPQASAAARTRLQLAFAAVEEREGSGPSARAALGRARASCRDAALAARIDGRRAASLIAEDRLAEAAEALARAEAVARQGDAGALRLEIGHAQALLRARRGALGGAAAALADLTAERRSLGDELGALRVELDRAWIEARRGEELVAGELATAADRAARALGLAGLAARARLVHAALDVAALRVGEARAVLAELAGAAAGDAWLARERAILLARLDGRGADAIDGDELAAVREATAAAALAGDHLVGLEQARRLVVLAERAGRGAELAEGLALLARLELAAGDRASAQLAAARAAREAAQAGATRTRVHALLALAALARDGEDVPAAAAYARDAVGLATGAGLAIERLVAEQALAAIALGGEARGELPAVAATMAEAARDAAQRMLADLGLSLIRPFRVIGAAGQESHVADASAGRLRMDERDLVVDGVREAIVRRGEVVADLRRRSLLKRLLFLFAGSPGVTFSKEEIVEKVWHLEYHPLRHDAALFTNIMRIRRLLGADGAELIRVNEEGYRFTPSADFLFVAPAR
jgi:hypothetical protein